MKEKAETPQKTVKAPKRNTKAHKPRRGIRELPSGRFQVRYTDPYGQVKSGGTFLRHDDAVERLDRILRSIDIGTYEQAKAIEEGDLDPKALTLKQLADHWRSIRVNKFGKPLAPKTRHEYERLIQSTLATFKDKPVRAITSSQIEKWWASEYLRAPRQANAAYKHLSTLMDWAVKRKLITANPCDIDGATSYKSGEPPAPTAKQVEIMLDVAAEEYKALIAFAAWGGLRKGEILALRRSDIEIVKDDSVTDIYVHITRSVTWEERKSLEKEPKNNSVRTVVMPPVAHEIITRHLSTIPISPDALLFPRKAGINEHWGEYQINPIWRNIRAQAGFIGRFHSLRAFHLTQYGQIATIPEFMARGGHRDIKTAMRYQRTTGRERDLVRKLG